MYRLADLEFLQPVGIEDLHDPVVAGRGIPAIAVSALVDPLAAGPRLFEVVADEVAVVDAG